MEKIKLFLKNILTGNKLASRLAVVPFSWIPIGAAGSVLRHEPKDSFMIKFAVFAIVYIVFTFFLYLVFKKITASKRVKLSDKKSFLYLSIILLQCLLFVIPYGVQWLISWNSLFLTIPMSFVITLICTIMITEEKVEIVEKG